MEAPKKIVSLFMSFITMITLSSCSDKNEIFSNEDTIPSVLANISNLTTADDYLYKNKIEDDDKIYHETMDKARFLATSTRLSEMSLKVLKAYIIDALGLDYNKARKIDIENRGFNLFDNLICTIYYTTPLDEYHCVSEAEESRLYEYNFRLDAVATDIYKIYYYTKVENFNERFEFNEAYKELLTFMLTKGEEKNQKISFDFDEDKLERVRKNDMLKRD